MNENNTIRIYGETIEALENGGVALNGERVTKVEDLEKAVNLLIKSTISVARGY